MDVVPDVLPTIDPVVSTELAFPTSTNKLKRVAHGDIIPSTLSEQAPTLWIQPYTRGTKLVTIAIVNPDVPNVEQDGFDHRCHFLAVNIPVSATDTRVQLAALQDVIQAYIPAYAQKGAPYQRMSIFILEQSAPPSSTLDPALYEHQPLDVAAIRADARWTKPHGFNLRSFVDRFGLKPIGADLFRTVWDEGTAGVMQRAGINGWDVEFRRKRVEPLPYKRKASERYR